MKTWSKIAAATLLTLLAACKPPPTADEVTDARIQQFKEGLLQGCKAGQARQQNDAHAADVLCGCVIDELDKKMSKKEWQRATLESPTIFNEKAKKLADVCYSGPSKWR